MTGKAANRTNKTPSTKTAKTTASKSKKAKAIKAREAKDLKSLMKVENELTPRGPLNIKQQQFARELCLDWNQTQAAIRAGYAISSAGRVGSRLMSNVYIQRAVTENLAKMDARTEIQEDRIVALLEKSAFEKLEPGMLDYSARIRSRDRAAEMLGRIKSMFKDTLKHTGSPTVAIIDPRALTERDLVEIKKIQETVKANGGNGEHK